MEEKRSIKLEEAQNLLIALGLPGPQTNKRSAWVLLALADIKPGDDWKDCKAPLLQTYVIMEFIRTHYGQDYKPNSRETIRRQTLHQFEQAGIVIRNLDDPARPTNSKDNNYSLTPPIVEIIQAYPNRNWQEKIDAFFILRPALKEQYKKLRNLQKIPAILPDGTEITFSPGKHNQLQADIIQEFCPRFIPGGGIVLYVGDTASSGHKEGGKLMYLQSEYMESIGVPPMAHEKLPDVVVYDKENNWLFLIEAVTSHGPVSPKRWKELEGILSGCNAGRVYVSAFPDTKEFKKHAAEIAWETEVWISDKPDHMIHFNGDRFLGPH
jgi:adenine-specific DNA-methyltransferase